MKTQRWSFLTVFMRKFANLPTIPFFAQKNPSDTTLHARAVKARETIHILKSAKLVDIIGDKTDNFADNVFLTVFTQFRLKYNLLLITQDNDLAQDIKNIAKSRAVNTTNRIVVRRINKRGFLSPFHQDGQAPKQSSPGNSGRPNNGRPISPSKRFSPGNGANRNTVPEEERFAYTTSVTPVTGALPVSNIPVEGDMVTAERSGQRKMIKLVKEGPSGGEGTIYFTDMPDIVAKIYKRDKLDRSKYEKIKLMLTKNIEYEGICFPIACVYNQKQEFVGILMKKAQGKELQKCVFIPQLLKKNFPDWKRNQTVELCVTILKKIKYLHDRNIILGDINPNNILVVSSKEVYFVDTDSYQIEGYPCPVGTINFTAPEIQRKRYNKFLRTLGNERFAVATLLFMIMLPGKPPYSLQGGENQIDNIINMDFAYASGEKSNGKAPEGVWRFCWSHLPRYLKDDLYETFRKGGAHSTEQTRYSTGDWLQKFLRYQSLLDDGKLAAQDPMSLELFPTKLKKNPNDTYIKCKLCHKEVKEDWTEGGYCRECLNTGETYQCAGCGCKMTYSNYQKLIRKSKKHELCKNCNDKKNEVFTRVRCGNCRENFTITFGEKDFYDGKGFQLPKKCPSCRGNQGYNNSAGRSPHRPPDSPRPRRSPDNISPSPRSPGGNVPPRTGNYPPA